jgi:hypothetical protein
MARNAAIFRPRRTSFARSAFEEHRVRAGVAAPQPAEERRRHEQREADAGDQEEREPEVLRVEGVAEQVEVAVRDVDQQDRVAADLEPRHGEVDRDQQQPQRLLAPLKPAGDVRRVDRVARPVGVDAEQRVDVGPADDRPPLLHHRLARLDGASAAGSLLCVHGLARPGFRRLTARPWRSARAPCP